MPVLGEDLSAAFRRAYGDDCDRRSTEARYHAGIGY